MEKQKIKAILFVLLDSVLKPKSAAYVSGPLDTGFIYYDSLASTGKSEPDIRLANQEKLTTFANTLRNKLSCPVIDPGLLKIPDWTGHDYGTFFLDVLDIYVKECWFIDRWYFSRGATKEYKMCIEKNILCYDEQGQIISVKRGREMIVNAALYIERRGLDASKIRAHIP